MTSADYEAEANRLGQEIQRLGAEVERAQTDARIALEDRDCHYHALVKEQASCDQLRAENARLERALGHAYAEGFERGHEAGKAAPVCPIVPGGF